MSSLIGVLGALPDAKVRHCARGEVIVHSFVDQDNVFIIKSGFVKAYTIDGEGDFKTQLIQSEGELFPIVGIMDLPSVGCEFEAMTDCTVLCLPNKTVRQLLAERIDVSHMLFEQATHQFATCSIWVYNLTFKHARKRIVHRLLDMGYRYGIRREDAAIMLPPFNQIQIADSINMSRECVNRELQYLERQGHLHTFANRIVLVDPEGLRKEVGMEDEQFYT